MRRFDDVTVIFDLDGTLIDSAPDLAAAMNEVLSTVGRPALSLEQVRHLVGQGARALIENGLEKTGGNSASKAQLEAMVDHFIEYYQAHIADNSKVFPGCVDALEALKKRGAKLAVCTNKLEKLARPLLDALDMTVHFDLIMGRDSLAEHKPSPMPLHHAVKVCGSKHGIMVGDSLTDYAAAKAAGMPFLLYQKGYWGRIDARPDSMRQFRSWPMIMRHISQIAREDF